MNELRVILYDNSPYYQDSVIFEVSAGSGKILYRENFVFGQNIAPTAGLHTDNLPFIGYIIYVLCLAFEVDRRNITFEGIHTADFVVMPTSLVEQAEQCIMDVDFEDFDKVKERVAECIIERGEQRFGRH